MNEVQLDKNSYARRLRDECNQEGTIKCCAPPHHLLDAADEDVIAFAKQQGRLLLTFDRAIAFDQPYALGVTFPGILILALEDDSVKRMGRKVAMSLLRQFKERVSRLARVRLPQFSRRVTAEARVCLSCREAILGFVDHVRSNYAELAGPIATIASD